jgi:hypothetical protein
MPVYILLHSAKKRSDRNSLTMSLVIDCGNGDTPIEELKIVHVHGRGSPTKMIKSMEYERCVTGMKGNLKHVLEIGGSSADPKTILQARAIAIDCYKHIMDLTTNGVVVTDAIKYVQGKMDHLNKVEKNNLPESSIIQQ